MRSRFATGVWLIPSVLVLLTSSVGAAADRYITPAGARALDEAVREVAREIPGMTLVSTEVDKADAVFVFSFGAAHATTFSIRITRDDKKLVLTPPPTLPDGVDGALLEAKLRARVSLKEWETPTDSKGPSSPGSPGAEQPSTHPVPVLTAPLALLAFAARRALGKRLGGIATSITYAFGAVSLCALGWIHHGTPALRSTAIVWLALSLGWCAGELARRGRAPASRADET